jgi:hypothetical protein
MVSQDRPDLPDLVVTLYRVGFNVNRKQVTIDLTSTQFFMCSNVFDSAESSAKKTKCRRSDILLQNILQNFFGALV